MEYLMIGIIGLIVIIPLVFVTLFPVCRNHRKATGDKINYDSSMRKFVYRVSLSREEIIRLLKTPNDADELSCTFDFDRAVIKFSEYGSSREFYYQVQECDGFSLLMLEQVSSFGTQCPLSFKLNPFMIRKLQAEIIPYSQYSF